jgi:hypothetical protein
MDKLPQVLQKEIWEYVRGDREYWKVQYNIVMLELRLDISLADMGPHWSHLSHDLALVWGQSSSDPSWSYSILMYLSRGWELVAHFPQVRSREICELRVQELKRRIKKRSHF